LWINPATSLAVPGSTGDILYNNGGVMGASLATITATGSINLPDTQVIKWGGAAYSGVGLSQLAADTLAVGNGSDSDVSGAMAMTGLILFGSSYYSAYDAFHTTIYSGATQNWNLVLPETAGVNGQFLRNIGSGFTEWGTLVSADLPSVTSSTFSGFWGGLGLGNIFATSVPTSSAGFTANDAHTYLFYVSEPITITKVTINVTTVAASTAASVGIYSTGGTKLVDSGLFTTTTGGTGVAVATNFINGGSSGSPVSVTLTTGWYYYMFTTNSASNGFEYFGTATATNLINILNKNGVRIGLATATTGGAQNTSLGTVVSSTIAEITDILAAWFE
jgi:hypothetical protein